MTDQSLALKSLLSALNTAMTRSLALYEIAPSSSHFDVIASLTEACSNAGLILKPSHRKAVQNLSHYENPYYYLIDPDTGNVRHTVGGGVPPSMAPITHGSKDEDA